MNSAFHLPFRKLLLQVHILLPCPRITGLREPLRTEMEVSTISAMHDTLLCSTNPLLSFDGIFDRISALNLLPSPLLTDTSRFLRQPFDPPVLPTCTRYFTPALLPLPS